MSQIRKCRTVVLISGGGSNLQALLDRAACDQLAIDVCAVISNRADAHGLVRAQNAGVPGEVLSHKDFADRPSYDQQLQAAIDKYEPELVVLAGFMRILTPEFTEHFHGRMLNIHPSLLPKYPGLNTHQRALDAGDTEAGVSVHFVTAQLDGGPVIAQARVPIEPGDSAEQLAARVLSHEHNLYPDVVAWFAAGRLVLEQEHAVLDGKVLPVAGAPWPSN